MKDVISPVLRPTFMISQIPLTHEILALPFVDLPQSLALREAIGTHQRIYYVPTILLRLRICPKRKLTHVLPSLSDHTSEVYSILSYAERKTLLDRGCTLRR
jgi:hypothetical protein